MLKRLGQALEGWNPGGAGAEDPVVLLGAAWGDIVGAEVARCSHPVRVDGGALLIVTRSSAWSQQLSLLAEQALAAIRARLPRAGIERLRFRVGHVPAPAAHRAGRQLGPAQRRQPARPPAASAQEAAARLREDVGQRQRAKRAAGWKACQRCEALIAPGGRAFCVGCENALAQERGTAVARLLYEAPWLGFAGTAALVDGLNEAEYESIRARALGRWWETLVRARAAKRLSRDGRERLIASSYVVLACKLPPEEIVPATVRNVLGDELHALIYGTSPT